MIDVHILLHGEPQELIDRCVASMDGQPVNTLRRWLRRVAPERGRLLGYSKGNAPYVSYVDPDDYVEPRAFDMLLEAMETGDVDAAFGWEYWHHQSGITTIFKKPHHAIVLKRNLLVNYAGSWRVLQRFNLNRVARIHQPLYNWFVGDKYAWLG